MILYETVRNWVVLGNVRHTGAEDRLTSSAFERIQRTEAQNNGDEDKHNENFRENGQTMQL